MTRPPESTHDRLNRELWRMRLRGWPALLGTVALLAVVALAFLRVPSDVTYAEGTVRGISQLIGEDGPRQRASVLIDDRVVEAGLASAILHPAPGETVCLRRTVDALTRFERFSVVARTLCATPRP